MKTITIIKKKIGARPVSNIHRQRVIRIIKKGTKDGWRRKGWRTSNAQRVQHGDICRKIDVWIKKFDTSRTVLTPLTLIMYAHTQEFMTTSVPIDYRG